MYCAACRRRYRRRRGFGCRGMLKTILAIFYPPLK